MFIKIEETPNPETLKFLPGEVFFKGNPIEFKTIKDAKTSKLATRLLRIRGVSSVFIGRDFVTVTKESKLNWMPLKTLLLSSLVDFFKSGNEAVDIDAIQDKKKTKSSNPIEKQILELIESKVRPAVASHGGDIIFHSFKDGIVELELLGSCSGCPSATATLKMGVENMLKHFIPSIKEVRETRDENI